VFRRNSAGATDDTAQDSQGAQVQGAPAKERSASEAKKGRPTPKRSEAERNRYQSIQGGRSSGTRSTTATRTTPLTKEEKSQERDRSRVERNQRLEGMKRGDERYLSARDRGPARRLARDYVDAHRRPSEYYMFALILLLVAMVSHVKALSSVMSYLLIVLIVVLVIDGTLIRRGLRKLVAERLPGESTRGLTAYAVMRAIQIRRWRMPAPRVKPGAEI
jgi:hypothetical protein